jgi:hypothetical protein
MQNTKFSELYHTLSAEDQKRFGQYIKTSYHNRALNVAILCRYILQVPAHEQSYSGAYNKVYGKNTEKPDYKKGQIIRMQSKLYSLLEEFVVKEVITQDSVTSQLQLLNYLAIHQLLGQHTGLLRETREDLNHIEEIDAHVVYQHVLLEEITASDKSISIDKGKVQEDMLPSLASIEHFYIVKKLFHACLVRNRQNLTPITFNFSSVDSLIANYQPAHRHYDWYIELWIAVYKLLMSPDIAHYIYTKEAFIKNLPHLNSNDKKNIFIYLENQCRLLFDLRQRLDEVFSLNRLQIEEGLLLVNGILIPMQYRNIVGIGVYTGNIEFVGDFIARYQTDVLEFKDRDDLLHLCDAIYLFGLGRYDDCQLMLNKVTANNLQYKMDERRWRIKTYVELGMYTEVIDLVNSFRRFLSEHREELSEGIIQQNRNFLSVVTRLGSISLMSKADRQTLIDELQAEVVIAEKLWLMSKCML